jgi:small-conductance mechanosensitive channel
MDLSGFLQTQSIEWWNVLLAVIAVVVGWLVSRFTRKGVLAVLHRVKGVSESLALVTSRVVGYAILLLGIGVGLALLGANVQPLLAMVIIVGIVVVLVLRGVADNFAAGVLIQTRRPLEVGDEIEFEALDTTLEGTVRELNSRSVVIATRDGRTVHVPNLQIMQNAIVNDSARGARRSELQVRLERGGRAVDELSGMLVGAAAGVEGVHSREPARVLVTSVSTERVTARLQFWHGPRAAPAIVSDVVLAVAAALESAGVAGTVTSQRPDAPLTPPDPV